MSETATPAAPTNGAPAGDKPKGRRRGGRKPGAAKAAAAPAVHVDRKGPRRAVVVAGVRTPFVKAFGPFLKLDSIDLATAATRALIERTELDRKALDKVVWGGVVLPGLAPNIGREVALDLGMHGVEAFTCTRACASGLQAVGLAVDAIERGDADVVIAGGSDSTSNAEVALPRKAVHALAPLAFGKATPADMLGVLAQLMPLSEILPKMPKIAERTTGEVMGQAAERMAKRNQVSREATDAFAVRSHHRAAAAISSGRFDKEVAPVTTPEGKTVYADTLVRAETSVEALARLKPVFAKDGIITAGSSSALTDGAAAVLLMEEQTAKALGYTPLAAFESFAYTAVDPADQLLMGPALAIPKALDRAGKTLADMDYVDLHEAFAAQVLAVLSMMASKAFAQQWLGRSTPVGEVPDDKLNVHGGSVSIGHPFGATGARMVTTMANELHSQGKERAVLGICAAGGLGAGAVMVHPEA